MTTTSEQVRRLRSVRPGMFNHIKNVIVPPLLFVGLLIVLSGCAAESSPLQDMADEGLGLTKGVQFSSSPEVKLQTAQGPPDACLEIRPIDQPVHCPRLHREGPALPTSRTRGGRCPHARGSGRLCQAKQHTEGSGGLSLHPHQLSGRGIWSDPSSRRVFSHSIERPGKGNEVTTRTSTRMAASDPKCLAGVMGLCNDCL